MGESQSQSGPAQSPILPAFLAGGEQTGALIAAFNWAATPLGPIERWPQSLKTATALLLRSPVPIVMLWGEDGYMIYNDAYSVFAGSRHPALLGSKVREGWREVADFNDHVMRVGLSGGTLAYKDQELTLYRHGGPEQVWMNLDYSPVLDESGKPAGVIAIVVETTERVQTERALRESEARFRNMADHAPALIWACDAEAQVTFANERYLTDFGLAPEAILREGWRRIVHEEDVDAFFATFLQAFNARAQFKAEVRVWNRNKELRWLRCEGTPRFDGKGAFVGYVGCNVDITEARLARDELERMVAERTHDRDRMWRLSTDIMLVADFSARIRAVNPAWTTQLGWDQDELLGGDFMSLIHPEDVERTLKEVGRLAEGLTTLRFENRYQHKDGTYRWLSWTAVPDMNFIHAVGRNIQAEKEAAEALATTEAALRQAQKMEAVGQLTGGIAHDFNNLLTGIIGSLDLMQRRISAGRHNEVERYVSAAITAANRAAALTHRLLAFSRRQPLDPKPVNANRLVTAMEELLRRTIGESVALEMVTAGGLWQTRCDPHQLESALLNLAINARDAMPDGGKLTVETCNAHLDDIYAARARDVRAGQYVCICVSDTGMGMSKDTIEKAFEPFFTTKPIGQGTGLGLSMVYGFARQSEGYAKIYSELDKGTTVKLYLPRFYGEGEDREDRPATSGPEPARHGEVVLVVEDETAVRDLVVEVLSDLGYAALEAADGPAGLAILEGRTRVDLLITDVGLPGLNGRQLADAARQHRPALKVLFMTGYAENAAINGGFLEPGMELITKPFAIDALGQKVRQMIESGPLTT